MNVRVVWSEGRRITSRRKGQMRGEEDQRILSVYELENSIMKPTSVFNRGRREGEI
jgi:hypothetical protein